MRSFLGGLRSACLCVFLSLSFVSSIAFAQLGDLVVEFPGLNAGKFVYDASRNRVYASITDQDQVAIIDNDTHSLITTIPVAPAPVGLAVSNDGNRLFVASSVIPNIEVIDLNILQPVNSFSTQIPLYDLVAANNDILYATPAVNSNRGIFQIDANAGFVMLGVNLQ